MFSLVVCGICLILALHNGVIDTEGVHSSVLLLGCSILNAIFYCEGRISKKIEELKK